jgi:hypothetical protein
MNGYEKILKIMIDISKTKDNIFITTMDSADSCKVNELSLDKDNLYISKHLTEKVVKDVAMSGEHSINVTYIDPLKKGDIVIVVKINEEKYVVLERVV